MNEAKCGALAKKLAIILGEIGKVPKSGRNTFHNYAYVTENDLVYAVREKLAMASVFVFTSVDSQSFHVIVDAQTQKQSVLTLVTTSHTFVDGESGESFTVTSQGQGSDVGDKGGYKAITGAMKYFLYKCFMIPTGDDPEADDKTDRRGATGSGAHEGPHHPDQPPPDRQSTPPPGRAAAPATSGSSQPLLRYDANSTQVAMFRGGKWGSVKLKFGKNKGKTLAELENHSLNWYADEWMPKPYQGNVSDDDLMLRAALDAYIQDSAPKAK